MIAYGSGGRAPALILYLAYLHSGTPATLAPATLASVHLIPYRETGPLIVYTLNPKDNRAVNALMAASSLGLRTVLVAPDMHPAIEELVSQLGVDRVRVPEEDDPLVSASAYSLFSAPQMMGARRERLLEEIGALEEAPRWLLEEKPGLVEAAGSRAEYALYSPVGEPAAIAHREAYGSVAMPLEDSSPPPRGARAVVFYSVVEQHDYKDVLMRLGIMGVRARQAAITTDPVTGAFYLLLAVRIGVALAGGGV